MSNAKNHNWKAGDKGFAWRLGFAVHVVDVLADSRLAVMGIGDEYHVIQAKSLDRI